MAFLFALFIVQNYSERNLDNAKCLKKLKFYYQFENYCFKLYLWQDFRVHTLLHYLCLIAFDDLLSDKHFLKATIINTSDSVEDRYTQISEFCIFSFLLVRLFSLQFQSTFCKTILKEGKINASKCFNNFDESCS